MAESIQKQIDHRRADRLENTPKRQREAQSQRIEADRLERTQRAMLALADADDGPGIPSVLTGIKTKAQVYNLVGTRTESHGYYHVCDTDVWQYQTDEAQALKALLENAKSAADKLRDEERQRKEKIQQLENAVKFSDIPGFFPTPAPIIARMIELANVQAGQRVLEPSAGKGDIADMLASFGVDLTVCEYSHKLCDILEAKGYTGSKLVRGDFLQQYDGPVLAGEPWPIGTFDRIVMNPPFERGQDMDHVRHAWSLLKSGGRLVSVMSTGAFFRCDSKAMAFQAWLVAMGGVRHETPGDFSRGFVETGAASCIVVIDR